MSENKYRLVVESHERCFLTTTLRGNNSSPRGSNQRPHLSRTPKYRRVGWLRKGQQHHDHARAPRHPDSWQFPEEFVKKFNGLTEMDGRKRYLLHVATICP